MSIAETLRKSFLKVFPKSLWVYHVNVGACNGCDIEVINVLTPYYDAERFGIKLVGSPRHADVLLVSGPVTRPIVPYVKRLWEAVPDPKLVFAVGSCACGDGIWYDTYNVVGGVNKVLPVNYYIPGSLCRAASCVAPDRAYPPLAPLSPTSRQCLASSSTPPGAATPHPPVRRPPEFGTFFRLPALSFSSTEIAIHL
jgi:Ni,Fe-hydrogenase III small subunit